MAMAGCTGAVGVGGLFYIVAGQMKAATMVLLLLSIVSYAVFAALQPLCDAGVLAVSRACAATSSHDCVEKHFLLGSSNHALLYSPAGDEPVHVHRFRLPDAMAPRDRLIVNLRVPVTIEKNHSICCLKVHTKTSGTRRHNEREVLRPSFIELGDINRSLHAVRACSFVIISWNESRERKNREREREREKVSMTRKYNTLG
jgi:hypothetical protein